MANYVRDTTPHLQRIAESANGQSFSKCFSHGINTRVSSASILTGTHPSHHSVWDHAVPAQLRTVPELFADCGYHTACISRNSNISSAVGLDRGFDDFTLLMPSNLHKEVGIDTLAKYLVNLRTHSAGFALDKMKHSTPFIVNDTAKKTLRSFEGDTEPFFLYLHYNEPHRPYYPPLPYLDEYTDDLDMTGREAGELALDAHRNVHEEIAHGCSFSEEEWDAIKAMYDAEVAYTDECIGRLFDFVQSLDLGETIFVVTADHGELLGEHGLLGHVLVPDDAAINIPMVVHGFGDIDHQHDELVQHTDLMKTLVANAGGNTDQFHGVDLRSDSREHVIAQRREATFDFYEKYNSEFDTSKFHTPVTTTLRTEDFKLHYSEEKTELHRLPDEETAVNDQYLDTVEALESEVISLLENEARPLDNDTKANYSEAMKEHLADMGYVDH